MKAVKSEISRFTNFRVQALSKPSLLKESLDRLDGLRQSSTTTGLMDMKEIQAQRHLKALSSVCSCRPIGRHGIYQHDKITLATYYSSIHDNDCGAHSKAGRLFTARLRYRLQSAFLKSLVELSFVTQYGAGGFSIGISLGTNTIVRSHPLESFFQDIYGLRPYRHQHKIRAHPYSIETQDHLINVAHKKLWEVFQSGRASPNDVDKYGGTLIHVSTRFGLHSNIPNS